MKINIDKKAVGQRIKYIRLNKGMTLEEFGKLFDTSKSIVQRWENGVSLPNKERLKAICKTFDKTLIEILYNSSDEIIYNNLNYISEETGLTEEDIKYLINTNYYEENAGYISFDDDIYKIIKDICNYIKNCVDELEYKIEKLFNKILSSKGISNYIKENNILYENKTGFYIIEDVDYLREFYSYSVKDNETIKNKFDNLEHLKEYYEELEKYYEDDKYIDKLKKIMNATDKILEQIVKNNKEISDDLGADLEKSIKRIKELKKELDNK